MKVISRCDGDACEYIPPECFSRINSSSTNHRFCAARVAQDPDMSEIDVPLKEPWIGLVLSHDAEMRKDGTCARFNHYADRSVDAHRDKAPAC